MKVILSIICTLFAFNASAITLKTYNTCSLEDEVNADTMYDLKACILDKVYKRRGRNYPIYIYMDSPGGGIYQGLRFIAFAKTIKNLHTITNFAASMAAAIVQGLPGKRYVVEHGITMFHRARGGFQGQFEDGELESKLRLWKKIVRSMEQMQADRIGITLADYKEKRKDEWWLYGDENTKANVSDELVVVTCSSKLSKQKYKVTYQTFFGEQTVEYSRCPMAN